MPVLCQVPMGCRSRRVGRGGLCFEGKACTGDVFYVTSLSEVEESKRREEKT